MPSPHLEIFSRLQISQQLVEADVELPIKVMTAKNTRHDRHVSRGLASPNDSFTPMCQVVFRFSTSTIYSPIDHGRTTQVTAQSRGMAK